MNAEDVILEVTHLEKSFGSHDVLRDISFQVAKGDVVSVIGASGSGKSTMLDVYKRQQLHMGHALDNTMQDILIRYKRMQGYNALWQPGTDHASIATEVKVIESLKEQGIDKDELGREGFLEKAWELSLIHI